MSRATAPTGCTFKELRAWRISVAQAEGGTTFLGFPDRWLDAPTWRCVGGHVSRTALRTEGGAVCLACMGLEQACGRLRVFGEGQDHKRRPKVAGEE